VRKQRVVLEHHADAAFLGGQHPAGAADDFAADADFAALDRLEAGDAAQRCGLAAAGGAEQTADRTFGQGEGEVGDDLPIGVRLRDGVEDQFSHGA
jgi:hypothetical protein